MSLRTGRILSSILRRGVRDPQLADLGDASPVHSPDHILVTPTLARLGVGHDQAVALKLDEVPMDAAVRHIHSGRELHRGSGCRRKPMEDLGPNVIADDLDDRRHLRGHVGGDGETRHAAIVPSLFCIAFNEIICQGDDAQAMTSPPGGQSMSEHSGSAKRLSSLRDEQMPDALTGMPAGATPGGQAAGGGPTHTVIPTKGRRRPLLQSLSALGAVDEIAAVDRVLDLVAGRGIDRQPNLSRGHGRISHGDGTTPDALRHEHRAIVTIVGRARHTGGACSRRRPGGFLMTRKHMLLLSALLLLAGLTAASCNGDSGATEDPSDTPTTSESTPTASPTESPWTKEYTAKQLASYEAALRTFETYERRSLPIWNRGKATPTAKKLFRTYFRHPTWIAPWSLLQTYDEVEVTSEGEISVYWSKPRKINKAGTDVEISQCIDYTTLQGYQHGEPTVRSAWMEKPQRRVVRLYKAAGYDWLITDLQDANNRKDWPCTP
jgi:predicted small secreted protein